MSACPRCGMMPTVTLDYHLGAITIGPHICMTAGGLPPPRQP